MYELGMIYSMEETQRDHPPGTKKIISNTWNDRYQEALVLSDDLATKYLTVPAYLALLSRDYLLFGPVK